MARWIFANSDWHPGEEDGDPMTIYPGVQMPEGGRIEVGFYHSDCNYANYDCGYVEIPKPPMAVDSSEETHVCRGYSFECGRCNKVVTIVVHNQRGGPGVFVDSDDLPATDVYYRHIVRDEPR